MFRNLVRDLYCIRLSVVAPLRFANHGTIARTRASRLVSYHGDLDQLHTVQEEDIGR